MEVLRTVKVSHLQEAKWVVVGHKPCFSGERGYICWAPFVYSGWQRKMDSLHWPTIWFRFPITQSAFLFTIPQICPSFLMIQRTKSKIIHYPPFASLTENPTPAISDVKRVLVLHCQGRIEVSHFWCCHYRHSLILSQREETTSSFLLFSELLVPLKSY